MESQNFNGKYWQSLSQYANDPQFAEKAHKEFISSPLQEEEGKDGFNRRDFMKLMAASTALASSACFQKPMHKILPYVNQPEEITFGVPNYYASTCGECASGCGVLVKTREGRPIKLEGNPDHPMSQGALCARGQASILNLYDPDRLKNPVAMARGTTQFTETSWSDVDKKIAEKLKSLKGTGGRVRILTGSLNSPTTLKLINDFLKEVGGQHVMWDPVSADDVAAGQEASYGTRLIPHYRFDKADVIVSIDGDFLGTWLSPVEFTKQWNHRRKLNKQNKTMSRLITFESVVTLTGTNADVRVAIRPGDGARVALAIANELVKTHHASGADAGDALNAFSADAVAKEIGFNPEFIRKTAKDLWEARGKSLVVAGSAHAQSEDALSLQVAVNLLNSLLGNDGVTVEHASPSLQDRGSYADLTKLIKDMNAGQVDALLIWKSNPVYALPKAAGFSEAAKKVGLVVSFNDRVDETAAVADYVLPDNHPLESWGDAEPQKGLYSLVQPTIRPIYNTRGFEDSLIALSKAQGGGTINAKDFHEYLQNNWRETIYKEAGVMAPAFQIFWETALRDGVRDSRKSESGDARAFKGAALRDNLPKGTASGDFVMAFYTQVPLYDGSTANNPWLQELPDPVSRYTWDNYLSLSPKAAAQMHVTDGDVVSVKMQDTTLELPAQVQPGLHEKAVAVALGYGRTNAGSVGSNIGQNMFAHSSMKNNHIVFASYPVSVTKTGKKYPLAGVQEHHTMESRPIVKEATLEEWNKTPYAGNEEKEELTTIWSGYEYKGYRWAMAIDLNSCTGCSACVVACNAENNVPVVGKDGVLRGRIMHWLRIDRYYSGTPDNPTTVHQPMLCQHCENAPCETVCPVIATSHDDEGLNQQTYNRCVGTRYCANNCPYKVRRFNWFEYNFGGQIRYPQTLAQNPEVTVRSRGVMEKCSFCVQRIHEAKSVAKNMNRSVQDGDLQTACQQSCPGDAIVFGNINNPESAVTKAAKDPRGYHVLDELNTRPSITYLTKIRNVEQV